MPIPSNITPATATVITAADLPFTDVLDVSLAPTGVDYPDCSGGTQYAAVWYSYTVGTCDGAIAVRAEPDSAGAYTPILSLWTGTLPDLVPYMETLDGEAQTVCADDYTVWRQVPVQAGDTIYFQVTNFFNAAPDVALKFRLQVATNAAIPAGTLLVPSDQPGFQAALLDPTIGTLLRLLPFPACEQGAILRDGTLCIAAETGGTAADGGHLVDAYEIISPALAGLFTVTTAMLNGGSGGSPPAPPGPSPPPPPPPGGGCTAFVAPAGMDAGVAAIFSANGATICASLAFLASIEGALNAIGWGVQHGSPPGCGMRYRLHHCAGFLTVPLCSGLTCQPGHFTDFDIESNGLWTWVPR